MDEIPKMTVRPKIIENGKFYFSHIVFEFRKVGFHDLHVRFKTIESLVLLTLALIEM